MGKDHGNTSRYQQYAKNWRSLTFKSGQQIESVYEAMQRCQGLIYPIDETAVLQYVALESVYLGTPVIYKSSSMISRYMPDGDIGRVNDFSDVNAAIETLLIKENAEKCCAQQRKMLEIIEDVEVK